MVKSTKNTRIWFTLIKLILFIGVSYILYHQLSTAKFDVYEVSIKSWVALGVAIILVPVNWWIEFRKWQLTLKVAEVNSTRQETFHSFLAGIVTGMLTPNMIGNFIGRMYYFQRRHRVSITLLTLFTNYAQFAISMFFGFIALIYLFYTPFGVPSNQLLFWIGIMVFSVLFGLFYFDVLFRLFFPGKTRLYNRLKNFQSRLRFHWGIAGLSLLRHLVFTLQLFLTLSAFGANIGWEMVFWIWQYYFWVTLTPSLFLGKIVVRDSVAIWVFSAASLIPETIIVSSLSIWILNLLLPTFFALMIVRKTP